MDASCAPSNANAAKGLADHLVSARRPGDEILQGQGSSSSLGGPLQVGQFVCAAFKTVNAANQSRPMMGRQVAMTQNAAQVRQSLFARGRCGGGVGGEDTSADESNNGGPVFESILRPIRGAGGRSCRADRLGRAGRAAARAADTSGGAELGPGVQRGAGSLVQQPDTRAREPRL
ncbi:hypothetical protein HDU83_006939 [Entophlyctis luteolus]|nr:hypothetical protein HDU83_006939 [Entophlyctis luteolus]